VAVNIIFKTEYSVTNSFFGGRRGGKKFAQKMNKLKNDFFFGKSSQKFTKTAYNMKGLLKMNFLLSYF